jgi:predicted transcriptional regulator
MDTGTGPTGIYIPTTRATTGIGGITKHVAAANVVIKWE